MDAIEQLGEFAKGETRGGRYYRRVSTGNPKRPWRYFYTKQEYERAHGEGAHRNGEEELRHRSIAGEDDPVYQERKRKGQEVGEAVAGAATKSEDAMDAIDALGELSKAKPKAKKKGKKQEHPVSEAQRRWAFAAESRGQLPKGKARQWSRRVEGENLLAEKSEDAMREINPAALSKGLYDFYDSEHSPVKKIKDAYLADYVDAFVEEAYEHERRERLHSDPNLLPATGDPAGHIARAVYNELCAFTAKNSNLARAQERLKITPEYVQGRMRALNLLHVDSENHNASDASAVSGYHPTPLALSADAEIERNEMVRRLGELQKGEEYVRFDDDKQTPFQSLSKAHRNMTELFHEAYGQPKTQQIGLIDDECPFHGKDPMKAGLMKSAVHGAMCTCG